MVIEAELELSKTREMFLIMKELFFVLAFVVLISAKSLPQNSITSKNVEVLDDEGKYILGWEIDESGNEIIFEVEAETLGYVGFGISPQGGMTGADIFIGGVYPNGTAYFQDRFGIGLTTPKVDDHEDWKLLAAIELSIAGKTILKFSRALNTCDDEDYPIGNDTTRLIWSMGETDVIQYHNTRRGTKSTNLLHADLPELDLDNVITWPMTLDMEMPPASTSYWCSFHKGPHLSSKHHVVGFDALQISHEAKLHTHHFTLYNCYLPPGSNETMDEVFGNFTVDKGVLGELCYEQETSLPFRNCKEYVFVWAKGGKQIVFPENVGYPIGEAEGTQYYMLEIHYDNPNELSGVRIDTGLQFYYTDELREHDAGLITFANDIYISLTVPPNTPDYKVVGHCSSECTEHLPQDGITIFNSLLHSHLSGRKMKSRHFRGNVELPWIDFDNHYDFNYQQNKHLMQPIHVFPGDHITVECTYDSTWKNGEIVVGGLSTREEMCENTVWYYPKNGMDLCGSVYDVDTHMREFGITAYHEEFTSTWYKYFIDAPESLAGDYYDSISHKFNWTVNFQAGYTQRHQTGMHYGYCISRKTSESWFYNTTYPENLVEYVPVDQCTMRE